MNGYQGAVAPEFELTVEESTEARPLPGFHVTRTRTFFVDNRTRATPPGPSTASSGP